MRKSILLLLLFNFITGFSYAESKIDSLLYLSEIGSDQQKASILLELVNEIKFSDPEQAGVYAKQGIALSERIGNKKLKANHILHLGIVQTIQSDFKLAMASINEALTSYVQQEDIKGIAKSHNVIGMIHGKRGNYTEAFESYNKALLLYETLEESKMQIRVKGNIANLDYKQGKYDKALLVFNEILDFAIAQNDKVLIARYLANVGRAYSKKGDLPNALKNYYLALPRLDSLESKTEMLNLLNNIGLIFSDLEMYELATENFQKGLLISYEVKNEHKAAMIHSNLGQVYINTGLFDQALIHVNKAIRIYNEKDIKSKGNLLLNLATIQMEKEEFDSSKILLNQVIQLGEELNQENIYASANLTLGQLYSKQNNLIKAEEHLLISESIFHSSGDLIGLNNTLKKLIEIFEKKDDQELTWAYKERQAILKDSLYGLNKMNQIIRLRVEQEIKQQNAITNLDATHNKEEKNQIPWILYLILGISIVPIYYWIRKKQQSEKSLHKNLIQVAKEKEEIKRSLEKRNLEITFMSLDMAQKVDFIKKLKIKLELFAKKTPENKEVRQLINSVHFQNEENKDWEFFKKAYQNIFPFFFDKMLSDYPTLSSKELRHCALIRLKIPLQEVAEIFGISINSVHKARHRLRIKFDLERSKKLETFILNY